MRTLIGLAAITLLLSIALPAGAQAQGKKVGAKCPADYYMACLKRCTSSGGSVRYCPDYCNKRKAQLGC